MLTGCSRDLSETTDDDESQMGKKDTGWIQTDRYGMDLLLIVM